MTHAPPPPTPHSDADIYFKKLQALYDNSGAPTLAKFFSVVGAAIAIPGTWWDGASATEARQSHQAEVIDFNPAFKWPDGSGSAWFVTVDNDEAKGQAYPMALADLVTFCRRSDVALPSCFTNGVNESDNDERQYEEVLELYSSGSEPELHPLSSSSESGSDEGSSSESGEESAEESEEEDDEGSGDNTAAAALLNRPAGTGRNHRRRQRRGRNGEMDPPEWAVGIAAEVNRLHGKRRERTAAEKRRDRTKAKIWDPEPAGWTFDDGHFEANVRTDEVSF
jgi:hypothetical protein